MSKPPLRRLLVINPNTTAATTQRIADSIDSLLPDGVALQAVSARFGAPYIACEASYAVAGHALLDAWARCVQGQPDEHLPDAVLIACFGDPGLFALRESSACPVTGLAEASFIEAAALGPFAIVTGGERWRPMLRRLAQALGFDDALRHIDTVAATGAQLQADPAMALDVLGTACRQAQRDGVRSIILGGAGLTGYAAQIQSTLAVPLIDSVHAGARVALSAGTAGALIPASTRTARVGSAFDVRWHKLSAPMSELGLPPDE